MSAGYVLDFFQTSIPVTASASGVIVELFVEDGEKVEKGDKLFKIQVGGMNDFVVIMHYFVA